MIDTYANIYKFTVYISGTVKSEVEGRIQNMGNTIGRLSRSFYQKFIALHTHENVEIKDLETIRNIFAQLKQELGSSEHDIIDKIERELVAYILDGIYSGKLIKTVNFVNKTLANFSTSMASLNCEYLNKSQKYPLFTNAINQETCNKLNSDTKMQKTVQKKPNDIKILCEVEAFQQDASKQGILVTLDRKDFLNNASAIYSLIGVICCDPIYLPLALES